MPRDGSGIYTQPFPNVVDGTTIESAVYNGFTNDVALQLNGPIPVSAGGTGGSSAASAAANLGVVTGKAVMTYTEAEKTQARSNIYAAPFDALAYNGMQINGGMDVSQQNGATAVAAGNYITDGWKLLNAGGMTAVVNGGQYVFGPPGHTYSMISATSVAQASITGTQYIFYQQMIEGYRIAQLAWGTASAQPITIGFWTAHVRVGVFGGSVRNSAQTRTYAFTYTQAATGTWQYNTVTIPGCTDGVWVVDNGVGINLSFAIAAGPTLVAPSTSAWHTTSYLTGPGQVNGVQTTSDTFRLTGVVVLPGIEAPSAARSPLIMRPFDQEVLTCQRYFRIITPEGAGAANSTTTAMFTIRHSGMRVTPGIVTTAALTITNANSANYVQSTPNIAIAGNNSERGIYTFGNFTGLPFNIPLLFHPGVSPNQLMLDARL